MHHKPIALVLVASLALQACSTRYLPPPRAPERAAVVAAAAPPLREGDGQVTLDVVGGPARADLVTERLQGLGGTTAWSTRGRMVVTPGGVQLTTRPLCITPCAVNLPLGQHEILFSAPDDPVARSSTGFVNVTPHPSIVRHALGRQETHLGGLLGALLLDGLGFAAMAAGAVLLAFSGVSDHGAVRDYDVAGYTTLGVGAAMLTSGIVLGHASRPESQPGATTQWTP
jgi:hypothetical protein